MSSISITDSEYKPTPYVQSSLIKKWHSTSRFGYSNEFARLISKESAIRDEYITGLKWTPYTIAMIYLMWVILQVSLSFFQYRSKKVSKVSYDCVKEQACVRNTKESEETRSVLNNVLSFSDCRYEKGNHTSNEQIEEQACIQNSEARSKLHICRSFFDFRSDKVNKVSRNEHLEERLGRERTKLQVIRSFIDKRCKYVNNLCNECGGRLTCIQNNETPYGSRACSKLESTIKKNQRLKCLFQASIAICVVVLVIYMFIGVRVLKQSVEGATESVNGFDESLNKLSAIIEEFGEIGANVTVVQNIVGDTESWCPGYDKVRNNETSITDITNEFHDKMQDLADFVVDDIFPIQEYVDGGLGATEDLGAYLDMGDKFVSVFVFIFLSGFMLLLYVSMGAHTMYSIEINTPYASVKDAISFLILALISVSTVALICLFTVGLMSTADFCSGGKDPGNPRDTILAVMEYGGLEKDWEPYQAFEYYIYGCREEDAYEYLKEYKKEMGSIIDVSNRFYDFIDGIGIKTLSEACEKDVDALILSVMAFVETMVADMERLADEIYGPNGVLHCKQIVTMYKDATENTVCTDLVSAFSWGVGTMSFFAAFGHTIVTLYICYCGFLEATQAGEEMETDPDSASDVMRSDGYTNGTDIQVESVEKVDEEDQPRLSPNEQAEHKYLIKFSAFTDNIKKHLKVSRLCKS